MGKCERIVQGGKVYCAQIWQSFFVGILTLKICLAYLNIYYSINIKLQLPVM